ncbi:MAG: Hsp20/alpha crystallin family protein [Parcubacteria group bacterium]|jgi:HSP20 family protein
MNGQGLMRWSPFRDIDRLFDEDMWPSAGFVPAMDVRQDKDNVIVEMALPGIEADKVEVHVENDVLTVSGHREEKRELKREDYYRKEIREGSFSRSVVLPMHVKGDKATAAYEKGMLKIMIPKAEEAKPKKIAVKIQGK